MTQPIGYFHIDKEGFSIAIVERTFWEQNEVLDGDTEDARTQLKAIGLEEKKLFDEE